MGICQVRADPSSAFRGTRRHQDPGVLQVGVLQPRNGPVATDNRSETDRLLRLGAATALASKRQFLDQYGRSVPELVGVDLTDDERALLASGLREWGGPATPTDDIANLLGFTNVQALHDERPLIARIIGSGEPLAAADWRRALLATEVVFASDLIGSGADWSATTGLTDDESIRLLRSVQRTLGRITRAG